MGRDKQLGALTRDHDRLLKITGIAVRYVPVEAFAEPAMRDAVSLRSTADSLRAQVRFR